MILIAFLGNYLVNNVAAGLAALIPPSQGGGLLSAQYLTFVLFAAITTAIMAWWYLMRLAREIGIVQGLIFGVVGFVTAIVTAFITGIAGVLLQTNSLAQVAQVLPHFGPYLLNWTTLILLGVWIIPAVIVGAVMQMRMKAPAPQSSPMGQSM